jgi:hypothetical protein
MSDSNYGFEPTLDGLNTINSDSSTITDIVCDTIQINVSGTAPTMPPLNNSTNIATTAYVDASTTGFMDLTSTQTATGEKSFNNANTYIAGTLKKNSASAHSIKLDDGTFMYFNAENMAFTTTASLSFSAAAYWVANCESNYYFQKQGISNTLIIMDNGGAGNGQMYINATNGGPNYIQSYEELQILSNNSKDIKVLSAKDIYLIPSATGTTYISSSATGNAPIIIGSSGSTTQTATHNAITTFSKIPSCAVAPTSANHLCNYTYVNSLAASPLGGANVWTGTNAFNTNLPTSTLTPTTGTELTTKTYVDGAITTAATGYAKLGSANAFTSTNTFNSFLPTSTVTPTTGTELTTKTYVDSVSGSILGTANAFTNTNTFNSFLPTSTVTPTTGTELTTKTYVDGAITTAATGYAKLGTANAFTSTNTFNTNLPTSTLTPTTGTQLTTKTYVDGAITTAATGYAKLATANAFTGTNGFVNTHDINITGGATTTIGNGSASLPIVNLNGTVNINSTTVRNTNIGNTTGITTVTGQFTCLGNTQLGDAAADFIVPNGTMTKPWVIGTYASVPSFSLASITPVTTYLGGTIQTSATYGAVPTGSFKYLMVSVAPYNASGGIALTAGTYMFWIGINFEDSSAFAMTDLRLGMSNISTLTSASTEAQITASLPNLTCYFHKTDQADAAGSDSEQRVLSGCFNLASATTIYPFYGANHAAVTMDTISCDVVITKIGGP